MGKRLSAVFCAKKENNLVDALRQSGYAPQLAENAMEAIELAEQGTAVFLLADHYPSRGTQLTQEMLDAARAKQLKLYVVWWAHETPRWRTGGSRGEVGVSSESLTLPRGVRA